MASVRRPLQEDSGPLLTHLALRLLLMLPCAPRTLHAVDEIRQHSLLAHLPQATPAISPRILHAPHLVAEPRQRVIPCLHPLEPRVLRSLPRHPAPLLAIDPDILVRRRRRLRQVLRIVREAAPVHRTEIPIRIGWVDVGIKVDAEARPQLRKILLAVLRRHQPQSARPLLTGGPVELPLLRFISVRMFVAIDEFRRRGHHVKHAVHEPGPERTVRPSVPHWIVAAQIAGVERKHPEREKRHVGVFPEDGGEHLGPALPREPRRLVICGIIRLQTVLFRFRIILGVHENSPQSTLLRQPGDCPHVRGEGPPGRIVCPGETLSRRPPGTEKTLPQRRMLHDLAEGRDMPLQLIARPEGIGHHRTVRDGAAIPEPLADHQRHAVDGRAVEGVRMRKHLLRRHRKQIPPMRDVFLLHGSPCLRSRSRKDGDRGGDHQQLRNLHHDASIARAPFPRNQTFRNTFFR